MPRQFVMGDIHGCLASFQSLVREQLKLTVHDELYLLGDYIDRGPSSKRVIDYILKLEKTGYQLFCLKGNHEQLFLDCTRDPHYHDSWMRNGGYQTLRSYQAMSALEVDKDHYEFINSLPYYFDLGKYLLVHAGFNFNQGKPFEDKQAMLWIRNFSLDPKILGGRKIIHGHTPTTLAEIRKNIEDIQSQKICLDGGCVYNHSPGFGFLMALELTSWKLYIQPCIDDVD